MSSRWRLVSFKDEGEICFGKYRNRPDEAFPGCNTPIISYRLAKSILTKKFVALCQKVLGPDEVVFNMMEDHYIYCDINARLPGNYVMAIISQLRIADECYKHKYSTGTYCNDFPKAWEKTESITNPLERFIQLSLEIEHGLRAHLVFLPDQFRLLPLKKYIDRRKKFRSLYKGKPYESNFMNKGWSGNIAESFGLSSRDGGFAW